MNKESTITKKKLVWRATKKPLKDIFGASLACFALGFVFGFAARFFDKSIPAPLQLLGISFFFSVVMFLLCSGAAICCALTSLHLLRRQEKFYHFSFAEEQLTWDDDNPEWFIRCELCRVLALRRGFIIKAGQPKNMYRLLYRMRVKDITGKTHLLKGSFQHLDELRRWINASSELESK